MEVTSWAIEPVPVSKILTYLPNYPITEVIGKSFDKQILRRCRWSVKGAHWLRPLSNVPPRVQKRRQIQ